MCVWVVSGLFKMCVFVRIRKKEKRQQKTKTCLFVTLQVLSYTKQRYILCSCTLQLTHQRIYVYVLT